MDAIIYTTNSGSTRHYAKLLAHETGLPVYSLSEAKKAVCRNSESIYLGWIMAGAVKGYAQAAKLYNIRAVCGVGMTQTGTQIGVTRQKTRVPAEIPLFMLQGNFDLRRLRGAYRLLMRMMVRALEKKKDRTAEENSMLAMLCDGVDRVDARNLAAVLEWYGKYEEGK